MPIDNIKNQQDLLNYLQQGHKVKYLAFWGHTPKNPTQTDKSCLSQWYPASFIINEQHYPTAEHYMMAEKARLFGDSVTEQHILACSHPNEAKQLGRGIANFSDKIWLAHRFDIVVAGNVAKFQQNFPLQQFLLATGQQILVEASPVDKIWGIGLPADHAHLPQPHRWQGLNLLGFALMQVRSMLNGR